jgi:hypothetical protein
MVYRKTKRKLRQFGKRLRKTQKGGIGTIPKLLAGLAFLAAPKGTKAWENALFQKNLVPSYTPPTWTAPSYPIQLPPSAYEVSYDRPTPLNAWLKSPTSTTAPTFSTTPSPMPAPSPQIASFAKTPTTILETASNRFLQGAAEITETAIAEVVSNQRFGDGVTIAGHNTLTTSTISILGQPIVSVNQQLSLDQYLQHCVITGKCFLDIDMWNSEGKIISSHGGPIVKVLNRSPNVQDTDVIVQRIHQFAAEHPTTIFTIRIENHDLTGEDIRSLFTPEMESQIATFSKHEIPSYGELQAGGKNIVYFIENVDQGQIDQSTGIFVNSPVMAQGHYFVRTNWNDIKGLTSGDDILSHLNYDAERLPARPMILIDGYNTVIAANVSALPTQSAFVSTAVSTLLPRIQGAVERIGRNATGSGCVIMMDYINADAFSYQLALDFVGTIPDAGLRATLEQYMPALFVETQAAVFQNLRQGFVNAVVKAWNATMTPETIFAATSLILLYYILAAFVRKLKQVQRNREARLLEEILQQKVEEHAELKGIIEEGARQAHLLDSLQIDSLPFGDDPSTALTPISESNSNAASEPRNLSAPSSPVAGVAKLSKSQKKRLRKREVSNEALARWAGVKYKGRGGYTRKLRR